MLTVVLLAPSLVIGLAQWFETESVVFFISMRVLESAMALGMIAVAHGSIFPISGILRSFGGPLLFGAIHVAILQPKTEPVKPPSASTSPISFFGRV